MKSSYKPKDAQKLLSTWQQQWWVGGGNAIDLYLDKQTREHDDLDIVILRRDSDSIRELLNGWDLWIGLGEGKLEDQALNIFDKITQDQAVLWCRPSSKDEWAFELLFTPSDGEYWIFKRDDRIRLPIESIGLVSQKGIPYLRPEIVLLFKAKSPQGKNQADFDVVRPSLDLDARLWLKYALGLSYIQLIRG